MRTKTLSEKHALETAARLYIIAIMALDVNEPAAVRRRYLLVTLAGISAKAR
jgi:hypothetical protein